MSRLKAGFSAKPHRATKREAPPPLKGAGGMTTRRGIQAPKQFLAKILKQKTTGMENPLCRKLLHQVFERRPLKPDDSVYIMPLAKELAAETEHFGHNNMITYLLEKKLKVLL